MQVTQLMDLCLSTNQVKQNKMKNLLLIVFLLSVSQLNAQWDLIRIQKNDKSLVVGSNTDKNSKIIHLEYFEKELVLYTVNIPAIDTIVHVNLYLNIDNKWYNSEHDINPFEGVILLTIFGDDNPKALEMFKQATQIKVIITDHGKENTYFWDMKNIQSIVSKLK